MEVPDPTTELFKLLTEPSWREALSPEFAKPYMADIARLLQEACATTIGECRLAPPLADVFRAFNLVPVQSVRAVVVGQDPYPHAGDADGLAFSVRRDTRLPDALSKILAEARRDLGWKGRKSGNLEPWAACGVLLLNAILTNVTGGTLVHSDLRWETFTRAALQVVAHKAPPSAILLWGNYAKAFAPIFAGTPHRVISSDHPCASRPLTGEMAEAPFKGSRPFSRANEFLEAMNRSEVDWTLPAAVIPAVSEGGAVMRRARTPIRAATSR